MANTKENLVTEFTTGIPGWVKGVVWGAVIFGGAYAIYKLSKGVSKAIKKLANDADYKREINKLESEGMKLSYTDAEYRMMADQLFAALDGWFSENEEDFLPVFIRMRNRADVLRLIQEYGVRDVSPIYGPESLPGHIARYFTDSQKEQYINRPLRTNRVDYQF